MEENKTSCPACGAESSYYYDHDLVTYRCPVCGRHRLRPSDIEYCNFNKNHLAAFLAHNAFDFKDDSELRYYTTAEKETFNELQKNDLKHPVHIDSEIVEAWYPRSFAEKIDLILLYLHKHAPHIGQSLHFNIYKLYSFLFVDRYDLVNGQYILRENDKLETEAKFIINCLIEQNLIAEDKATLPIASQNFTISPHGYARIDEIQRNTANGKNVLVAMSFHNTKALREAIREGIQSAGYVAIFIDEVQHNELITPELLKHIKDSKFVVVDLTHQNNGAYFEEGYAMGLGKPVIQLCRWDVKLHFDVAQKNTIIWTSEADIPPLLCNRIKATID